MNVLESPIRKKEDYVWLFHLVSEVLKGIRMGVYFPKKSFLCGDCEYEVPCGAWRGNGENGLPEPDYRNNKISAHI